MDPPPLHTAFGTRAPCGVCAAHYAAAFSVLDLDCDGVVSRADLVSFLCLNPLFCPWAPSARQSSEEVDEEVHDPLSDSTTALAASERIAARKAKAKARREKRRRRGYGANRTSLEHVPFGHHRALSDSRNAFVADTLSFAVAEGRRVERVGMMGGTALGEPSSTLLVGGDHTVAPLFMTNAEFTAAAWRAAGPVDACCGASGCGDAGRVGIDDGEEEDSSSLSDLSFTCSVPLSVLLLSVERLVLFALAVREESSQWPPIALPKRSSSASSKVGGGTRHAHKAPPAPAPVWEDPAAFSCGSAVRWLAAAWGGEGDFAGEAGTTPETRDNKRLADSSSNADDTVLVAERGGGSTSAPRRTPPPPPSEGLQNSAVEGFGAALMRMRARSDAREVRVFYRLYRGLFALHTGGGEGYAEGAGAASSRNGASLHDRMLSSVAVRAGTLAAFGEATDVDGALSFAADGAAGSGSGGSSSIAADAAQRLLLEPPPLSMTGGAMDASERSVLRSVLRWGPVRAAAYGVAAALVIAGSDLLAQWYILGEDKTVGESLLQGLRRSLFFLPSTMRPWDNTEESIFINGTYVTLEGSEGSSSDAGGGFGGRGWIYQLVVFSVSFVVSVIEVTVIFMDGMWGSFEMAKSAGVPLFRLAEAEAGMGGSSDSRSNGKQKQGNKTARGRKGLLRVDATAVVSDDDESLALLVTATQRPRSDRSGIAAVRRRIEYARLRFVAASLSRAAANTAFCTATLAGITANDRRAGMGSTLWGWFWPRLRRAVPTFLLRVVVGRFFPQYAVPFVSTPLLAFWNYTIARETLRGSRGVVVGVCRAEACAAQLLSAYCSYTPQTLAHNAAARTQALSATGLRAGGGVPIAGLLYCPFAAFADLCCVIAFYVRVVGRYRSVHPSLHLLTAYALTHIQHPDRAAAPAALQRAFARGLFDDDEDKEAEEGEDCLAASAGDDTARIASGGADDALEAYISRFCAALDAAAHGDGGSNALVKWEAAYADAYKKDASLPDGPFAFYKKDSDVAVGVAADVAAGDKSKVVASCDCRRAHATKGKRRMACLLGAAFPSWARPRCCASPPPPRHVEMCLVVAALCAVMAPTGKGDGRLSSAERDFLAVLFGLFAAASTGARGVDVSICAAAVDMAEGAAAAAFCDGVVALRRRFADGGAVGVEHIIHTADRALQTLKR